MFFVVVVLFIFYLFIYFVNITLKEETFAGRNFRGSEKTAKYLHFAGINFRGEPLSKDFPGIKKGENLNL